MTEITIIVEDLTEEVILGVSSSSSTFIGNTDTPSSYSGQAGKTAVVNSGENAMEFTTPAGGGDMLKVTYDPTNKSADAFDYGNFNNTPTTITGGQASAITANTAKTGITAQQSSDITTNNSKVSYTDASQVATNKTNADASKIITDHITVTQAVDLDTMESNISTNNAKTGVTNEEENTINTEVEGGMTGEDLVLNVLSLTTAEHTAGTPVATTFYIITDA